MMRFNSHSIKYIFATIGVLLIVFFACVSYSQAQTVSTQGLHINEISDYNAYSLFTGNNVPGMCLFSTFYSTQPTSVRVRTAPMSTVDNPVWTYNPTIIPIQQLTSAINMQVGFSLQPGTEYIAQFLEVASDGTHHIITPQNTLDDLRVICTPNSDGTLNESCPSNSILIEECSIAGVNAAQQESGGGDFENGVTISNVVSDESSIGFDIDASSLPVGQTFNVVYTTNSSAITSGSFQGSQSVSLTAQGSQSLAVTLVGLQANTTYYVTIIDQSGLIIIDTATNAPYEILGTGTAGNGNSDDDGTGTASPVTINVNIDGTFGQTELAGENIEQGFTQCGYGETYDCDFNQLLATIDRIIKFMLYVIILPLAAILFAWSGIKLIIAQSKGKSAALSEAKQRFGIILLGLVFAMGAWVIVKFILVILGYTDASGLLTQILGITTTQ